MKRESKDGIHGRIRAKEVISHINFLVPEYKRQQYKENFLKHLGKYSFKKHKVGEERHEGCKYWLEDVVDLDFRKPEEYALIIMGDMDRKQQKDHAKRFYNAFVRGFWG